MWGGGSVFTGHMSTAVSYLQHCGSRPKEVMPKANVNEKIHKYLLLNLRKLLLSTVSYSVLLPDFGKD